MIIRVGILHRLFGISGKTTDAPKANAERNKVSLWRSLFITVVILLHKAASFSQKITPFTYYTSAYREYTLVQKNELEFRKQLHLRDSMMRPMFLKRAATFGILDSEVDLILDDMRTDLFAQYRKWTNEDFLREIQLEIQRMAEDENIIQKDSLLLLQQNNSLLREIRPLLMGNLIITKLAGRCTEDEMRLLGELKRFDSFRTHTSQNLENICPADSLYYDSHKRIRLVLMGRDNWDDICSYAQHELTHFLNHEQYFLPVISNWYFLKGHYMQADELQSLYFQLIDMAIFPIIEDAESLAFLGKKNEFHEAIRDAVMNSLRAVLTDLPEMSPMQENLDAVNKFFSLFSILDESLAYLSEKFTSHIYDSNDLARMHTTVADNEDFQFFYNNLSIALQGKDQKEFDESCMQLCTTFLNTWKLYPMIADYELSVKCLLSHIQSLSLTLD